jgi:ABC-type multidrug transport system fused ATPase/permease subunit
MVTGDALGFLTILLLFGTPLLVALLIFIGWLISSNRKSHEIASARESYERMVREKLDVIKTAVAMGRTDDEIRELDRRLERLIGSDKLQGLLDSRNPRPPAADQELQDIRQAGLMSKEL